MNYATLNLRGTGDTCKRELIDRWGHRYKIGVIMLQETKINENICYNSKNYKWFFSTSVKAPDKEKVRKLKENGQLVDLFSRMQATEYRGVGFAVHNDVLPCVELTVSASSVRQNCFVDM